MLFLENRKINKKRLGLTPLPKFLVALDVRVSRKPKLYKTKRGWVRIPASKVFSSRAGVGFFLQLEQKKIYKLKSQ